MLTEDQLIDLWETIDARVEELLEGVEPLPASHTPFDPTSQLPVAEQRYTCSVEDKLHYCMSTVFYRVGTMGMIKMLLIDACHPEAVSLLRAARYIIGEVWPVGGAWL